MVLHGQDITNRIVGVTLDISAHRFSVIWVIKSPQVIVFLMCTRKLAEMLTTGTFCKAVNGIIGVVGTGVHWFVAKVDKLLGLIPNMDDIPNWIVSIVYCMFCSRTRGWLAWELPEGVRGWRSVDIVLRRNVRGS